jgi:hypothetical protein
VDPEARRALMGARAALCISFLKKLGVKELGSGVGKMPP